MPVGIGTAALGAGVLGAGASLASGAIGAGAAKSAAKTQVQAQEDALAQQKQMFSTVQGELQPFITAGTGAIGSVQNLLGLTGTGGTAGTPDTTAMNNALAATPGYQFALNQGEQAVQSNMAAQGLASSGAAIKGAESYAEGLASTTYQQQLNNYLSLMGSGQQAAEALGGMGLQSQAQSNALTVGAGQSAASGTVGAANSITGALSGVAGSLGQTAFMLGLNNNGLFGNGQGAAASSLPYVTVTPNQLTGAYS